MERGRLETVKPLGFLFDQGTSIGTWTISSAREHVFVFQYKCPVDGRPGDPNLRLLNHRSGILIQKRALESDIRRRYTGHDTFKFMAGVETLKEVHEVCRLQVDRSSTFTWGTDC